jgi:gliding motility-associated-like protein
MYFLHFIKTNNSKFLSLIGFLFFMAVANSVFAQRGKDGVPVATNTIIVNEYTTLTANANTGSTSLNVANSSLNMNNRFTNNLQKGDLVLIIQMQGVSIDQSGTNNWGSVSNYNNCGNYEWAEVSGVPNGTTINIRCGLINSYTSSGKVQVVRVPRFQTANITGSITAPAWNGSTGGIVVVETIGDLLLNSNNAINVSGAGFRGATADVTNSFWGGGMYHTNVSQEGGSKGEGIFGFTNEYSNVDGLRARGPIANGGGGGNGHNAGGGGGANGGNPANWNNGVGVPNAVYNTAWALESPSISGTISTGGGKGGYSFSGSGSNPLTTAPGSASWGSDLRRNVGGLGGYSLDYASSKIFMGGGGGSGDRNDANNSGGSGGNGGGIVLIKCYGQLSGNGSINANGLGGVNTTSSSAPFGGYAGNDGSGGGGAGGAIVLDVQNNISSITCNANGGNGGNQILVHGSFHFSSINEAEGPGGGGSGGVVKHSNGTFTSNVNGGANGTTNSDSQVSFPPNGATSGGTGETLSFTTTNFELVGVNDTICAGNSASVSVNVIGSLPIGTNLIWYDENNNFIGAGSSFSTTNISNDTTFYVGACPGTYTIPVSVIMGSSFSYNDNNINISDENCGQTDGSISGITITGGALPLQYEWNSVLTSNQNLSGVSAGTYTLVVTDNNGCASTIGTYDINENTGPIINDANLIVEDDHCGQGLGSISGITTTGNNPLTLSWNGITSPSLDLTNLDAGNYDLIVEDNFGCTSSLPSITVADIAGPTIDTTLLVVSDASCEVSNGAIANLSVINPSSTTLNIVWDNSNETTLDINNLSPGSYSLSVTDTYGCIDNYGPILINNISSPIANFSINNNPTFIGDSVFFISTSSSDVTDYYFTNSTNNQFINENGWETYLSEGEYEVCLNVENAVGCLDSLCQSVTVIPTPDSIVVIIPNVLTANGDGKNDLFTLTGLEDYTLEVFNRWGQEVYSKNNYNNTWDGRNNAGKQLPSGTYYYILTPPASQTEKEILTGYLLLNR